MALHKTEAEVTILCDGITVGVTHPTTLYFPDARITKYDLVTYYATIAPRIFQYGANHLLTLERYPGGITHTGFYQKEIPESVPTFIARKTIQNKTDGTTTYAVLNHPAVIPYLAQYGCITPHLWLSSAQAPQQPDRLIFDLDPPHQKNFSWQLVQETAFELHDLLNEVGLKPFLMTTGSRGLHVVVPIQQHAKFDRVRRVARQVAQILVARDPHHKTLTAQDKSRRTKLFIDYLRNAFGATAVSPYAVRALPDAPVATPLAWSELHDSALRSSSFTIKSILQRIAEDTDPCESFFKSSRPLF
jgi:bifunctional non-homologous end joining protein LigD